jgi:copper chaperone CopZ
MQVRNVRLAIEGMHCGGCVTRVAGALKKLEGVEVETVEVGSARIGLDEERTQLPAVLAAIEKIGFAAREA